MTTPLFPRKNRNILIAGHRPNRLPEKETDRAIIIETLKHICHTLQTSEQIISTDSEQPVCFRILVGASPGTDADAADVAQELKLPAFMIAHEENSDTAKKDFESKCLAFDTPTEKEPPSSYWIDAADKTKLALADILIVIWDGEPPKGQQGGTVHLVVEALLRFMPVIWISTGTKQAPKVGTVHRANFENTTSVHQELLRASPDEISTLKNEIFELIDNEKLKITLKHYLETMWISSDQSKEKADVIKLNNIINHLNEIDPGENNTVSGVLHSGIFNLISNGTWHRRQVGPVRAWLGPAELNRQSVLNDNTLDWFNRLDRSATHAANRYRDNIFSLHILSSLAVFGAVAGAIDFWSLGGFNWAIFELLTLVTILLLVLRDSRQPLTNQQSWLQYRQAAEALRLATILQPNLSDLPPLHQHVWKLSEASTNDKPHPVPVKYGHWLVNQILREQGPLSENWVVNSAESITKRKDQLRALLDDQIEYHNKTHEKNEILENRLHSTTKLVFICVLIAVLAHIFALGAHYLEHHGAHLPHWINLSAEWVHHQKWLLLITAFFPALAAALHGIKGMFEFERTANNSALIVKKLKDIKGALEKSSDSNDENRHIKIRNLAIHTAEIMYQEHDAWLELMETQILGIPA
jgi:hypothetical protein